LGGRIITWSSQSFLEWRKTTSSWIRSCRSNNQNRYSIHKIVSPFRGVPEDLAKTWEIPIASIDWIIISLDEKMHEH
jgi:hypothetical protein